MASAALHDRDRTKARELRPGRLSALLARLGPLFVKIGQFLALRPDLLPREYCDELLRLVDRAPPVPWSEIEAIIAADLQAAPEQIFEWISSRPLAAGSIAQVHVARTRTGEMVAVKVQRPNLAERVERDLRRARALTRAMDAFGIGPLPSARETLDEISRWLHEELDFQHELRNQLRLSDARPRWEGMRIPRPFPHLSGRRVVTSEYLEGTPFSDVLQAVRRGDDEALAALDLDLDALAEHLIEATFHQIFTLRRFHADPHPGNLIAMPGDVVGFVDFGLTDVLPESLEAVQFDYLAALYGQDVHGMYRAVSRMITPGPRSDIAAFRRDFIAETTRWMTAAEDTVARPHARSSTAEYMILVMQLVRRHEMRVPVSVLSVYRALLTAESVAHEIGSGADLRSVGRRFFAVARVERVLADLEPDAVLGRLLQLADLTRSSPGDVQEVLSDLAEGRFVLNVQKEESRESIRAQNQRTRLLTLAIVSTGLAFVLAVHGLSGHLGALLAALLGGALAVIYAWMIVIWWRLD